MMPLTYSILGSDGQTYGPVTLQQLQSWIVEGRVDRATQVCRSDQNAWRSAEAFDELVWTPSKTSAPGPDTAAVNATLEARLVLQNRMFSGANWFFWIAGLSAINTFAILSGGNWAFVIGLGITQVFDAIASHAGPGAIYVAIALDVIAIAVVTMFGVFARKGHNWSFITGMILYGLDSFISLLAQDWLGLAFHVFAILGIFSGYKANRELKALPADVPASRPASLVGV